MWKKKAALLAFMMFLFFLPLALPEPASAVRVVRVGSAKDYPADGAKIQVPPNVLFYIDVSGNMTMSLKGMRPSINYVANPDHANALLRLEMLKQDTFGSGARHLNFGDAVSWGGAGGRERIIASTRARRNPENNLTAGITIEGEGTGERDSRRGRDIDPSNNIIGDPNCYYTLDPGKPYMLTFRDYNWANWNGVGAPPSDTNGNPMPAELRAHLDGPLKGVPVTNPDLERYLVPNDSKMYNLKLVLARLFEPTRENMEFFSRMRVGFASPFYDRGTATGYYDGWSTSMSTSPWQPTGDLPNSPQPHDDDYVTYQPDAVPYWRYGYGRDYETGYEWTNGYWLRQHSDLWEPPEKRTRVRKVFQNVEDIYTNSTTVTLIPLWHDGVTPPPDLDDDSAWLPGRKGQLGAYRGVGPYLDGGTRNIGGLNPISSHEELHQEAGYATTSRPARFYWFRTPPDSGEALIGSNMWDWGIGPQYRAIHDPQVILFGGIAMYIDGHRNRPQGGYARFARSTLHVPFDYMYVRDGGEFKPTESLVRLREMIDGVEQKLDNATELGGSAGETVFVNDEFFPVGSAGSPENQMYDNFSHANDRNVFPYDDAIAVPHPYAAPGWPVTHTRAGFEDFVPPQRWFPTFAPGWRYDDENPQGRFAHKPDNQNLIFHNHPWPWDVAADFNPRWETHHVDWRGDDPHAVWVNDKGLRTRMEDGVTRTIVNWSGPDEVPQWLIAHDGETGWFQPGENVSSDFEAGRIWKWTDHSHSFRTSPELTQRVALHRRMRNSDGLMTGTVTGMVLDFFDPRENTSTTGEGTRDLAWNEGSADGTDDTRGYFPVISGCQENWVIYFSTGNEHNPGEVYDDYSKRGNMLNTLFQISMESRQMRGRKMENEKWVETTYDMDNPIRTIVVGLISTEDMDRDGDPYTRSRNDDPLGVIRDARNAMRRMARAGQPVRDSNGVWAPWKPGAVDENGREIEEPLPIISDTAEDLFHRLRAILDFIQTGEQASGAPRLHNTPGQGGTVLFASSYDPSVFSQWRSTFERYVIPEDDDEGRSELDWSAGVLMENATRAGKVYGGEGVTDIRSTPIPGLPDASRADDFSNWLISYQTEVTGRDEPVKDNGILGNMERSSPVFVRNTARPRGGGYDQSPYAAVFIQTNRGVLHALDYETGEEKWAFIPPPVFYTERLWGQKFRESTWIDKGDGKNSPISVPLMALDGLLGVSDYIPGNTDPNNPHKTYLTGALGLAGNGFYVMDITDCFTRPASAVDGGLNDREPKFLWSIDNDRFNYWNEEGATGYGDRTVATVDARGAALAGPGSGWEDLGLTITAPALRRVRDTGGGTPGVVGIIPGGLGWEMGWRRPAQNPPDASRSAIDTQGRAFYVFNPDNGNIITKFGVNGAGEPNEYVVLSPSGPSGARLGMGITPVYYIPATGVTTEFLTGDSEGNILYCDIRGAPANWRLRNIFRVLTVGPDPGAGDLSTPVDRPIALPKSFDAADFRGQGGEWLFGGTSNLLGVGYDERNNRKELRNDEQHIFALKNIRGPGYIGRSGAGEALKLSALTRIVLEEGGDWEFVPRLDGGRSIGNVTAEDYVYGWRIRLAPEDGHTGAEEVSASPHFNPADGVLYVATFTPVSPGGASDEDGDDCLIDGGYAMLYAIDPTTGMPKWDYPEGGENMPLPGNRGYALRLDGVYIAGISTHADKAGERGSIYLGFRELRQNAVDEEELERRGLKPMMHAGRTILELRSPHKTIPGGVPPLQPVVPHMQYWRETF